jgi:diaminohydroxyphosphoribosylaminopyrimidine deaminase/5-amino-6-(5-phosphoribosylamino)uracil reductase
VHALRDAGDRARGATAYVTLEPCAHHGRTPPCADALVAAGVARVVYAVGDPNPRVAGEGAARLAAAGIAVEQGLLQPKAEALNPGFLKRLRTGRPYVRVKLAASLDGRTALANGESRWITGEAARADVQRLRAGSSAILSSAASVLRDGARLTVREPSLELLGRRPLRVVLDRTLRIAPDAPLFAEPGPVLLIGSSDVLEAAPDAPRARFAAAAADVDVVGVAQRDGALDLESVLVSLANREVNDVLVEAGPALAGAFVAGGFVDELIVYLAPHLLGDTSLPLVRLPAFATMDRRPEFAIRDVRRVGSDLRLTLAPAAARDP